MCRSVPPSRRSGALDPRDLRGDWALIGVSVNRHEGTKRPIEHDEWPYSPLRATCTVHERHAPHGVRLIGASWRSLAGDLVKVDGACP
jgi:hypothetical protein